MFPLLQWIPTYLQFGTHGFSYFLIFSSMSFNILFLGGFFCWGIFPLWKMHTGVNVNTPLSLSLSLLHLYLLALPRPKKHDDMIDLTCNLSVEGLRAGLHFEWLDFFYTLRPLSPSLCFGASVKPSTALPHSSGTNYHRTQTFLWNFAPSNLSVADLWCLLVFSLLFKFSEELRLLSCCIMTGCSNLQRLYE